MKFTLEALALALLLAAGQFAGGEGINALGQKIGGAKIAAKFHLENGA